MATKLLLMIFDSMRILLEVRSAEIFTKCPPNILINISVTVFIQSEIFESGIILETVEDDG